MIQAGFTPYPKYLNPQLGRHDTDSPLAEGAKIEIWESGLLLRKLN